MPAFVLAAHAASILALGNGIDPHFNTLEAIPNAGFGSPRQSFVDDFPSLPMLAHQSENQRVLVGSPLCHALVFSAHCAGQKTRPSLFLRLLLD